MDTICGCLSDPISVNNGLSNLNSWLLLGASYKFVYPRKLAMVHLLKCWFQYDILIFVPYELYLMKI
jgi:hypothetical protein